MVKAKDKPEIICPFCGYEYDPSEATTVFIFGIEYEVCPNCGSIPVSTTLESLKQEPEEYPSEEEEYPSEEEIPEEEECIEEEEYDFSED
jgi:Zn-finger nucleic acid-binding protein